MFKSLGCNSFLLVNPRANEIQTVLEVNTFSLIGISLTDFTLLDEVKKLVALIRTSAPANCPIILGGEIEVPTIEGKKARLSIPAGTQSETQFRLRGKGMSILRQSKRGDMYIETNVEIPVNLNSKQKNILSEFEKEGGTSKSHSPKSQSFFKKIKEVWKDLT